MLFADALGPPPTNVLATVTCPHCWHAFPLDEILWVSRHAELLGDPVLGPDAPLRFRPSRFTVEGDALDARDTPCQLLACPHCHLLIPRSMVQVAPLYVSMIGAPASGKSYYLTSSIWELRRVLREKFNITLNDTDAASNQTLNEYEETLFLRDDPDHLVSLRKTELQGSMYDQISLGGQAVLLPKPFLFTLRREATKPAAEEGPAHVPVRMMCLYDNAGEHFLPGMDTVAMPGTQHLAKSRVLWFLFDPTQHPRFREQCRSLSADPQLHRNSRTQRQETLLNETADRIRRYTGLSPFRKYDRPLIVIVAKADIWTQLLGLELAREPLVKDPADPSKWAVDVARIETVSKALRDLLNLLAPEMVSAAEDFCSHVIYIPASALGRGPEIDASNGTLAIRPRDIHPQWVTAPTLYMLAKWTKGWLNSSSSSAENEEADDAGDNEPADNPPDMVQSNYRPAAASRQSKRNEAKHLELFYTSSSRGLRPGSFGFCTVAMTGGMPAPLVERLEALSGYRPAQGGVAPSTEQAVHSHLRMLVGTRRRSVLSQVSPIAADYSGRDNKLAHHLIVDPADAPEGGPAWTMLQPGVMADTWSGEPRLLSPGKRLPRGKVRPRVCKLWKELAGDAGWAGVMAEMVLRQPEAACYVIHPPGISLLPLIEEVTALLPVKLRWQVTFSTGFTTLPQDLSCAIRCVPAGTAIATEAIASAAAGRLIVDLTRQSSAPDSEAAQCARDGIALTVRGEEGSKNG